MRLSINTGFLVNRYPDPNQWANIVNQLGVKNIQLTSNDKIVIIIKKVK